MKKTLIYAFTVVLVLSGLSFAEKPLKIERNFDLPSFLGWVDNEVVVVIKEQYAFEVSSREARGADPFAGVPEFDALADRFQVVQARKQFQHRAYTASQSVSERRLALYYKVLFNSGSLDDVVAAYESLEMVDHVERIGIHTLYATPNDTYYDNPPASFPYDQWHYWDTHSIHANQAWDAETGSSAVKVGILDSGTRYFHIDLGGDSPLWGPDNPFPGGNIFINPNETPGDGVDNDGNGYVDDVIGWDFVASAGGFGINCIDQDCGTADNDPDDGDGHGTHVSGTVAAISNNGIQVAGVAGGFSAGTRSDPGNGVEIIPCRIGYHARYQGVTTGVVRMDYAAEAMDYISSLVDAGQNVAAINCSWGSSNSGGLGAAVDNLLAHDVVIVVAAGNSNSSSADYLNARGDCLDVAATDQAGNGASFSNYGSWVDVAAPGVSILSTYANPDDPDLTAHYIALLDGTSMAAPHVTGIAALLESCNPSLSGPDKMNLIINNTDPYNDTRDLGSGIANAFKALTAAGCTGTCTESTPVADFSGSPTSGDAPLNVNFTDLSANNPDSWSWDFGDGGTSSAQNPSHDYTAAGTYTVTLTASNCAGSDVSTKVDYITVTQPACTETTPVADFSGSPTSGDTPLNVSFTDLSSNNPDTWSWDFGDGGTSTAQNPSHEYAAAGTYTVTLTAWNCAGSDVATKTDYITVTQPAGGTMHVHDIVVTRNNRGPNCSGVGTITIYDANEQPVANATVSVTATGPTGGTGSAATGADGTVSFETSKTKSCSGEWCFEVTDVIHGSLTYDAGANHVTQACESGWVFGAGNGVGLTSLPTDYSLSQNYPNPFNPTTEISFSLPEAGHVILDVYNISGQRVAVLADGLYSVGSHSVTWDASGMASGIYLYRLVTDDYAETKKMILLK